MFPVPVEITYYGAFEALLHGCKTCSDASEGLFLKLDDHSEGLKGLFSKLDDHSEGLKGLFLKLDDHSEGLKGLFSVLSKKVCKLTIILIFALSNKKQQEYGTYTRTNFGNYFELHK